MALKEINNEAVWESLLARSLEANFLQSWAWGEFQKQAGLGVRRYAVGDEEIPVQIIVHQLPFGWQFWYAPYAILKPEEFSVLVGEARKEKVLFIRVESARRDLNLLSLNSVAVNPRQPHTTLVIDLTQPLEMIRNGFHQKTRYNIGLAERKGVTVVWEKKPDIFFQLMRETATRDKFKAHDDEYYQKLILSPIVEQATAYVDDEPIASGIFISYRHRYIYVHGASANHHRELMAPYALQWAAIKRAQEFSARYYDFWGIAPPISLSEIKNTDVQQFHNLTWDKNHSWAGVTRFKAGFGGTVEHVGPAFEIPVREGLYKLFRMIKKLR